MTLTFQGSFSKDTRPYFYIKGCVICLADHTICTALIEAFVVESWSGSRGSGARGHESRTPRPGKFSPTSPSLPPFAPPGLDLVQ